MNTSERMTAWVKRMEAVNAAVKERFGNLSEQELRLQPDHGTWSIAENLEHLRVVNNSYRPIISEVRAGRLKLGRLARFAFISTTFGKMILRGVEPSRKRKMNTFAIWQPKVSPLDSGDVAASGEQSSVPVTISNFIKHQEEFAAFMLSCQDLVEAGQIIYSPANHRIIYSLEQAFEIIVTHEERHLNQATELLLRLKL